MLIEGKGDTFYRLSNSEGKQWLIPARNMRVALNIYQPTGRNGKLLKSLFPLLHRIPLVRKAIGAQIERCKLNDEINDLLESVFNHRQLEFAVFFGTPCVHQKITVQISRQDRILGYFKISDNPEIASLFRHEAAILDELYDKGVRNIPKSLYCGKLNDGRAIFVQSTVKSGSSEVMEHWSPMHDEFVGTLYRKTHKTVRFETSDYFRTLTELRNRMEWLPDYMNVGMITAAIDDIISGWQGKDVDYSAYHGDFTPWNTFAEAGRLFVFDWEYAGLSYPPMLDRYHFFTQTAIFKRHATAEDIIRFLQTDEAGWVDRQTYKLYLIEIIARFTLREKGNICGNLEGSMKIWGTLLNYLQQ